MIQTIKDFFSLLWYTLLKFIREEGMNHAAALSYYTVFALAPILIILISLIGFFWGKVEIESHLFQEMSSVFGEGGAEQIRLMLDKVENDGSATATIIGFATLLFSSTIVFYTIQHSFNRLWNIHHDIRHGFVKWVIDKFLSLAFITSFGFLLTISLGVQAIISAVSHYFGSSMDSTFSNATTASPLLNEISAYIFMLYTDYFSFGFYVIEYLLVFTINALMFAGIFKFLPDARASWKVVIRGGLLTAVLFELGQMGIAWKMGTTDFSNSYGAAGALIIVFVWIFYSSCILFYGGMFTFFYGEKIGQPIKPILGKDHNH
jgi:membrane protein